MATSSEEISKSNAHAQGKPDSNLSNDTEHLGGIPANDYATKDYVDKKQGNTENNLKEYIDKQDKSNLDKAKAYADSLVQNQDFSNFAKTTDVQALDDKLSEKIEACGTNCENKMNEKIKVVVDDVNSNFDDVGQAIEKLNQGQNDLFQSVSDGKAKIAGAITDKGVDTSATDTFDTMANNIGKIETGGGGEVDPNFVNTSDGTATENDIVLGKTAYVKGEKIYGTHTETGINTDDATATSSDIKDGVTAYARGIKIYGTHTDLNTDDATATSSDIKEGMTAYAKGRKITGTHVETGIDTNDATALASDIKEGVTAYARGEKITGTYVETGIDTEDATATASDIKTGMTAYAKGKKIIGTHVERNYPIYGTNTSGATATEADIAFGKTAWANGVLLTGTATNEEVEEIYTTDLSSYKIENVSARMGKSPDSDIEVTSRYCMAFTPKGDYCVSAVSLNGATGTDFAIESHLVTDSGLNVMASREESEEGSIVYKKYRYSKDELGIGENESLENIALAPHYGADCLLILQTRDSITDADNIKIYFHIYTYEPKENGFIGKVNSEQKFTLSNYIFDYTPYCDSYNINRKYTSYKVLGSNTKQGKFLLFSYFYRESPYYIYAIEISIATTPNVATNTLDISVNISSSTRIDKCDYSIYSYKPILSTDDKYLYVNNTNFRTTPKFINLGENFHIIENNIASIYYSGNIDMIVAINDSLVIGAYSISNDEYGNIDFKIFDISNSTGKLTATLSKTVCAKYDENNSKAIYNMTLSPDGKCIIAYCCMIESPGYSSEKLVAHTEGIAIFKVEDILNAEDMSTISPIKTESVNFTYNGSLNTPNFYANQDGSRIIAYYGNSGRPDASLALISSSKDLQNLLGVRYKDQFFANLKPKFLTALPEDVKEGKTFFGYNGEAESGTLKIESTE